jgi:hypothetical protein
VVVEMGLSDTYIGQLLLSATFVTDLATVAALPATPHGFRRCMSTSEISLPLRVSALGRSSPYDRERKPIGYQDDCQMILLKVPTMACRSSASTPVALP